MNLRNHMDRLNRKLTAKLNPSKRKAVTVNELMHRDAEVAVGSVRSSSGSDADDPNSFHRAMRPILSIAQMFGHVPVDGVAGRNADTLRFRWCSLKVVYTIFCILGGVSKMMIHLGDLLIQPGSSTFSSSSNFLQSSVATLNLTFCLILAKKWPSLQSRIQNIEMAMKYNYGYPKNFSRNLRTITFVILSASLAEHCMSRVIEIMQAMKCADSSLEWLKFYFTGSYPIIFRNIHFSFLVSALLEQTRIVQVFSWNFMDITVIVFSFMLTSRLRQVSARLHAIRNTATSQQFWRQIREDYDDLSKLVKLVDQHINKIILLTFGNNLYFICLQLLLSMQKQMSVTQSIYFYTSFIYLLLRSGTMCLIAASIYEESLEPKSALFSVPSESYSCEVQRFIKQVVTDTVALTGLKFFSITKMLLLTVVGTVVTYEIVLVQFDSVQKSENDRNGNPFCPNNTLG